MWMCIHQPSWNHGSLLPGAPWGSPPPPSKWPKQRPSEINPPLFFRTSSCHLLPCSRPCLSGGKWQQQPRKQGLYSGPRGSINITLQSGLCMSDDPALDQLLREGLTTKIRLGWATHVQIFKEIKNVSRQWRRAETWGGNSLQQRGKGVQESRYQGSRPTLASLWSGSHGGDSERGSNTT